MAFTYPDSRVKTGWLFRHFQFQRRGLGRALWLRVKLLSRLVLYRRGRRHHMTCTVFCQDSNWAVCWEYRFRLYVSTHCILFIQKQGIAHTHIL